MFYIIVALKNFRNSYEYFCGWVVFGIPEVQQSCVGRILEILNSVQQSETLSKSTSTRNWPEKLCIKAAHNKFQKIHQNCRKTTNALFHLFFLKANSFMVMQRVREELTRFFIYLIFILRRSIKTAYNLTNTGPSPNMETCIIIGSVIDIWPRQDSNQHQELVRVLEKTIWVKQKSLSSGHKSYPTYVSWAIKALPQFYFFFK